MRNQIRMHVAMLIVAGAGSLGFGLVIPNTAKASSIPPIAIGGGGGGGGSTTTTEVQVPTGTYTSTGYKNYVLDGRARGGGYMSGPIVPQWLETSSQTWLDGGKVHWSLSAYLSGSFMPNDGTVSPEMLAYNTLGTQSSHSQVSFADNTFWELGEEFYVDFKPGLSASISLDTNVNHNTWVDGDKQVDSWSGSANVSVDVNHGFIKDASSSFYRTDHGGLLPPDGSGNFYFSGTIAPEMVTITRMNVVPEPATAALIGGGVFFLRRRRVAWCGLKR